MDGSTVAHTSRARLPFEVITRSLYSGEANEAHFNLSITKREIMLVVFLSNMFTLLTNVAIREARGEKKGVSS